MERWEYRTIKVLAKGFTGGILELQEFDNELNKMGSEGWELVSCFDTNQSYGETREVVAVFKRKRSI
ncbi:MAG TPA: DUF4177 domain-containing protein [Methanosarcinales archaeon]|nr:DUF4177 domain-containing protein [Methanosarcinales archaeon]